MNSYYDKIKYYLILLFLLNLFEIDNYFSQISFTDDCSDLSGWTTVGTVASRTGQAGCSGSVFGANYYGSYTYGAFSRSFTSNGGEVTFTYDFSAHEWNDNTATPTNNYDVYVQYALPGQTYTTVNTMAKSTSTSCQSKTFKHTPASGTVWYRFFIIRTSGDFDGEFDNISLQQANVGPTITSATWTDEDGSFTACTNNFSSEAEFTVKASDLTGDLTVTPPAGFEISLASGSGFVSTATSPSTLTIAEATAESVAGEIIHVRMASAASNPTTANLSISGGGLASPTTESLSGTFTSIPSQPGTITPSSNPTCSGSSTTYTISSVTGATSYNWSFTGSGTPSGSSTTATLSPTSSGNIGVTATNSCGTSAQTTLAVTLTPSTLYVDPLGTDVAGNGTSSGSNAFATLTYAVSQVCTDVATTINVAGGTYTDESINITSSNLTISGAGATTIFDGDLDGRFLTVNASNFTLSNMKVKEYGLTSSCSPSNRCGGGAIEVGNRSNTLTGISVSGVTFTDNQTDGPSGDGGAVEVQDNCTVTIENCIFNGNKAGSAASQSDTRNGGAVKLNTNSSATINNCLFYENRARQSGGAIATWGGDITINNSTIADNTNYGWIGSDDAAVYIHSGTVFINNSILYNNYFASTLGYDIDGTSTTNYCIYRSTNNVTHNNTVGTSDPLFTDAANDDYTLQSTSPAIDEGHADYAPATDINGLSRPQGVKDDLGCYELQINTWQGGTAGNETVWSNAGNWSTGVVPGNTETITIANVTYNPVIDANDQVGSLTIQSGGVLTINSSVTLTASSVELQSGGDIVISNGELNCTGKFDHDGDLTMSGSGVLDIDGEYESSASATEIISGGTIEVAGEWDGANDDTFTPTGGTVTMNNSADKNLAQHANSNFYNLTIANSGGDVDVTAALDVDGDLTINASADLDIGGGNANLELAGNFINNGTFTTSGETITFDGAAGDKTSSAISDATLDIVVNKSSAGKVTFAGTCSFDEVTITNGILAITSNTMTADNTVNIANGAELEIGTGTFNADATFNANSSGVVDFTGAGKLIISSTVSSLGSLDDAAGTIEYDGGTQNVLADNYYNLEIDQSNAKTAQGAVNVAGTMTVQSGSEYVVAATTTTVTGTTDVDGTVTISTGTYAANGSSDVDGTISITSTGKYDADDAFDASNGNVTFTGAGRLECSNTVTSLGTLSTGTGTVEYDGGTQNVLADTYFNLEIDQSGVKTAQGAVNVGGTITIQSAADYSIAATTTTVTGATTISGDLVASTGIFDANGSFNASGGTIDFTGAGTLKLSSSVTSLGTLDDADGTVEYDGGTQNVISDTYNKLSIKSSGTKTATGNITVNGDLTTENTSGCVFDIDTRELTAKGGITVGYRGGLDLKDGTLNLAGSSAQSFTSPGSYTDGGSVSITTEQITSTDNNDVFQYVSGGSTHSSGNIRLGNRSGGSYGDCTAGLRFTTIPVPQGATITSASLNFKAYDTYSSNIYLKIYAEDVDDGTIFSETTNNVSSRTLTTAAVDWDITSSWTYNSWYTSSDISSVIQEIVNRAGWNINQDINIIIKDDGSSSGNNRNAFAYDYDASYAPKLDITYTTLSNSIPRSKNITITNPEGMMLSSDLQIEGTLNLNGGSINTNGNTVHVTSTGSVGGSKGTSPCNCIYPDGYSQELTTSSEVEFRIGNSTGTERKSIWVQPQSNTSVTFTADFEDIVHTDAADCGTGLDHISSESWYDLSRTGSVDAKVKIGWYTNDQVDDYASLLLAHYDGSQWQKVVSTPSGSNTSGTIISDGFQSSFSPFALGSSNSGNPLPIDLLSFGGECENGRAQLEFVVASQINNDYFSIYRSSNATDWNLIGEIEGAGNTSTQLTYQWIDNNPISGVSYYKLAQTDYDGTSEMFSPIAVTCEAAAVDGYSVYPNPANEVLNIDLELENYQGDDVSIEVIDINGKIIQLQQVQLARGYNHVEVDLSEIPSGVYMINFVGTRDYINESRIIKQ